MIFNIHILVFKTNSLSAESSVNAKCNHGGIYDSSWSTFPRGGINKMSSDPSISPHHYLHDEAAALAIEAGVAFFNDPGKSNVRSL